ncbi:MAG TPA: hypothetical protein PLW34_10960 [Termitinemataceae bacterium]|nr:hypothetical protein [Termitinemataceae bacterium]HOM24072.1 hypothetical protein [Termitinemataceae bacterium]HPQ01367.1 hypothetical protein [Termitinemataceae bacterium]
MKKVLSFSVIALLVLGFISLMGCPSPTAPTPGTDTGDTSGGGDTGSTSTSLYVYSYQVDTDFAYDVWSGTFTATDLSEGGAANCCGDSELGWREFCKGYCSKNNV